jgi:hypothetical protein
MPAGEVVVAPHEARYLAYLDAALTLNDAIDRAAKAGALRLRDRSTSLPVPDWHLPTWDRRDFLKRAILEGDNRRAIDFVVSSDWLIVPYPHFAPSLTVSLPEFSAWAVGEGLADAGEIERLLAEQPKEIPGLAGAVNAFFGGPAVDLEAGLYPNRTGLEAEQQAGPVIADQGAPASDTNEPPQEWQRGIRRVAWDAAAVIVERGDRLTPDGLEKQMLDSGKVELKEDEYHLKSSGSGLTEREMKAKPATIAGWVTAIKKQKLLKP